MGGIAWTEEEDNLLKKCIQQHGEGKWHRVPLLAGIFSLYIIFMSFGFIPFHFGLLVLFLYTSRACMHCKCVNYN